MEKLKKKRERSAVTWENMIQRCTNPKNTSYKDYGGRGITVCDRWIKSLAFFKEDMGDRPIGHELDRIDNSKGYDKENCRWVTHLQNSRNIRRSIQLTFNGLTMCLSEWADHLNLKPTVVYNRYERKLPIERILTSELSRSRWDKLR